LVSKLGMTGVTRGGGGGGAAGSRDEGEDEGDAATLNVSQLPALGVHTGWKLGLDEAWRKFVYGGAEARLRGALEEAAEEFAVTHNRLAYRAAFVKETGIKVPHRHACLLNCLLAAACTWVARLCGVWQPKGARCISVIYSECVLLLSLVTAGS
jgi:hypothetical protein